MLTLLILLWTTVGCTTAASLITMEDIDEKNTTPSLSNWVRCTHEIYCTGPLLHDVQLMHLFKDSKIFVDFKCKFPPEEIGFKYQELKEKEHGVVHRNKLKAFVEENFERGDELESWVPSDWTKTPSILSKISNKSYQQWIGHLNIMWRVLARRVKGDVLLNPESYSMLYVPNGFVIPGGRFTELYYWDTYWIINGLMLCDMHDTVKGVISNLIHLVKLIGHVPNGNRVYYKSRSQPPLLIQMVDNYLKATDDWKYVEDNLPYLEKEFEYWWDNHMVTITRGGKSYILARYFSYDMTPRPESYREDFIVARDMKDEEAKEDFYINIRSAAETGWDFSSRWMVRDGTNEGNLSNIAAPQIVPVDLNSFLHLNAVILSKWNKKVGNSAKAEDYERKGKLLLDGITNVLWYEKDGIWYDYDCVNKVSRKYFYASNLTPLFTRSYPENWSRSSLSYKIIDYLRVNNIDDFVGGVPTSLDETGEQWDFPNAWGPLQSIIIHGIDSLGTAEAKEEAFRLANKWLESNYLGFKTANTMYEKYDVLRPGQTGEGGEYVPQTGFGWTNGVILEIFDKYGEKLAFDSVKSEDRMFLRSMMKSHKNNQFVSSEQRTGGDLENSIPPVYTIPV